MLTDNLYKFQIEQIIYLQTHFVEFERFLEYISEYLHPTTLFLYVLPLFAIFNSRLYSKLLLTAGIVEYLNVVLKWIFSEYRPYWWVQETDSYGTKFRPILRQTRITCESTSGFPSGHSMFLAGIFWILCKSFINYFKNRVMVGATIFKAMVWIWFSMLLIFMTASRMYFGCHFMHQCLVGFISGIMVAEFVDNENFFNKISEMSKRAGFCLASAITFFIFAFYWLQKLGNGDPQWGIKMAFKWCENPTFVRPDSTPMYGFARDIGIAYAIAFASPLKKSFVSRVNLTSVTFTLLITFLQAILTIQSPKNYGYLIYYSYTTIVNFISCFALLYLLPKYGAQKIKDN